MQICYTDFVFHISQIVKPLQKIRLQGRHWLRREQFPNMNMSALLNTEPHITEMNANKNRVS